MTTIGHNGGPPLTEISLEVLYKHMEYARRYRRYVSHCPKMWARASEDLELAEAAYFAALNEAR